MKIINNESTVKKEAINNITTRKRSVLCAVTIDDSDFLFLCGRCGSL